MKTSKIKVIVPKIEGKSKKNIENKNQQGNSNLEKYPNKNEEKKVNENKEATNLSPNKFLNESFTKLSMEKNKDKNLSKESIEKEIDILKEKVSPSLDKKSKLSKKNKIEKSTTFEAFMNLLKSFISTQILVLPYLFSQNGYLLSIFLLVLASLIIYVSLDMHIRIAEKLGHSFIELYDTMKYSLGRKAAKVFNVFFVVYSIGVGLLNPVYYQVFLAIALNMKINAATKTLFAGLSLSIIIPMLFISNFHDFNKFSIIANLLTYVSIFLIMGEKVIKILNNLI